MEIKQIGGEIRITGIASERDQADLAASLQVEAVKHDPVSRVLRRLTNGFARVSDIIGEWVVPILALVITGMAAAVGYASWANAVPAIGFAGVLGVFVTLAIAWASVSAKRAILRKKWNSGGFMAILAVVLLAVQLLVSTALQSTMAAKVDTDLQAVASRIKALEAEEKALRSAQAIGVFEAPPAAIQAQIEALDLRRATDQTTCDANPTRNRTACGRAAELQAQAIEAKARLAEADAYLGREKRLLEIAEHIDELNANRPAPQGLNQIVRDLGLGSTQIGQYGPSVLLTLVLDLLMSALCMAAFAGRKPE
jgi:hypothetical protein